uniref:Uncharacterized protein n=1 Tax=Candidatus Kentrum sp. LFY TaxID=2126342 RepID=A0A450V218_9GAMM|nr:MAG: hypothetical protein BECKLFY1418A_GA0070994_10888 [Candidatus Kentron sp. LFY]
MNPNAQRSDSCHSCDVTLVIVHGSDRKALGKRRTFQIISKDKAGYLTDTPSASRVAAFR